MRDRRVWVRDTQTRHLYAGLSLCLVSKISEQSSTSGRSMYFDDSEYDFPKIAHRMRKLDVAESVLGEDGKGKYCFDRITFTDPFDILGFFLGYMSSPTIAES